MIRRGGTFDMVRLRVPGLLMYRDLALGVVLAAGKMNAPREGAPGQALSQQDFEDQTVSAFVEAFTNIARHGSQEGAAPEVDIELISNKDGILIRMMDNGRSFDPQRLESPELKELAESGMGLFIIKSLMDEVEYRPGHPNMLRLWKRRTNSSVTNERLSQ